MLGFNVTYTMLNGQESAWYSVAGCLTPDNSADRGCGAGPTVPLKFFDTWIEDGKDINIRDIFIGWYGKQIIFLLWPKYALALRVGRAILLDRSLNVWAERLERSVTLGDEAARSHGRLGGQISEGRSPNCQVCHSPHHTQWHGMLGDKAPLFELPFFSHLQVGSTVHTCSSSFLSFFFFTRLTNL